MAEETKEINAEMIYYRLDAIEKQLKDMAEDKEIQQKHGFQIHELKENQATQTQEIEKLKNRMNVVEQAPIQNNSEKLKFITDIAMKLIITACVTYLFASIGLKL